MTEKAIKVTCSAAGFVEVDDLLESQGTLAKLGDKERAALRHSLLSEGVSFAFSVWKNRGKHYLMDGHARRRVLLELRGEGWQIPPLPVAFIKARDHRHMLKKLLLARSEYHRTTQEGLVAFLDESGLDFGDVREMTAFGEVDFAKLSALLEAGRTPQSPERGGPGAALQKKYKVKLGQIWALGEHRIACADCADRKQLKRLMGAEKARCIFTDPPYGISIAAKNPLLNVYKKGGEGTTDMQSDDVAPAELRKTLGPGMLAVREKLMATDCSLFVCAPGGPNLRTMMDVLADAGVPVRHAIIWAKDHAAFSLGRLDYDYQHELILFTWGQKHKRIMAGDFRSTVWKVPKPSKSPLHPTMKPVALYLNAYMNHTEPGDVVADPFCGSGTAIMAAEEIGRRCRAVEIEPQYVAVSIDRWERETGSKGKLAK